MSEHDRFEDVPGDLQITKRLTPDEARATLNPETQGTAYPAVPVRVLRAAAVGLPGVRVEGPNEFPYFERSGRTRMVVVRGGIVSSWEVFYLCRDVLDERVEDFYKALAAIKPPAPLIGPAKLTPPGSASTSRSPMGGA